MFQEIIADRDTHFKPLCEDPTVLEGLCTWNDLPKKEVKTPRGMIHLRPVQNVAEVLEAEKMMRSCAEKGDGFAIDEFDSNGHFNRKFFKSTDIVVAESNSGEIVACALMGASKLSRTKNSVLAHQYMAVKENYSGSGIGTALIDYTVETMKALGYKILISDTFMTNQKMLQILRTNKWVIRGSLPYCGFIRGVGPVDSLLAYITL